MIEASNFENIIRCPFEKIESNTIAFAEGQDFELHERWTPAQNEYNAFEHVTTSW